MAAMPAAAGAQTPITPPDGDNYLNPVAISNLTNPQPFPNGEIGIKADLEVVERGSLQRSGYKQVRLVDT